VAKSNIVEQRGRFFSTNPAFSVGDGCSFLSDIFDTSGGQGGRFLNAHSTFLVDMGVVFCVAPSTLLEDKTAVT
jgi:hypothetical protein